MPNNAEIISEAIKKLRREQGLTQVELANALRIAPASVYRWEAGSSSPDVGMLIALWNFALTTGSTAVKQFSTILADNVEALKPLLEHLKLDRQLYLNEQTQGLPDYEQMLVAAFINFLQHSQDKTARTVFDVLLRPWMLRGDRQAEYTQQEASELTLQKKAYEEAVVRRKTYEEETAGSGSVKKKSMRKSRRPQ